MPLKLIPHTPKKSLNATFFKVRPLRSEIDTFKTNLITLLSKVDESEREENQKTHVRDFQIASFNYNIKPKYIEQLPLPTKLNLNELEARVAENITIKVKTSK